MNPHGLLGGGEHGGTVAEDPIGLFSTRAERYPQPDDTDKARTAIEKVIEQVPLLGPATVHIVSQFLMPAYQRRQEEWFKEIGDAIDQLEVKGDGFKIEDFLRDGAFVSAIIQASRSAISTNQMEKRAALRNALLNIALHRSTDEDQQQIFLRYIDELTVWHLRILSLFQDPPKHLAVKGVNTASYLTGGGSQVLEDVYPELQSRRDFYDQIVADLNARGLFNSPHFLHSGMSASGMVAKRTTPLADAFLAFIADPLT